MDPGVLSPVLAGDLAAWNAEAYRLRHSRPGEARGWAEKARALAVRLGDRPGEGRARYLLAVCRYIEGQVEGLETDLNESLRLMKDTGHPAWEAEVHNLRANWADRSGRPDEAAGHYRAALALYSSIPDAAGLAAVLNNLALVHRDAGRWSEALEAGLESLSWADRSDDPASASYPLGNLAQLLLDLDLTEAALPYVRRALAVWAEGGDESHRGTLKVLLGACLIRLGDRSGARAALLAGLAVARRTRNRNDEARALTALGRLLHHSEDLVRADRFLRRALDLARRTRDPEAEQEALAALGENHALAGRWEPARLALEEALGEGAGPPSRNRAEAHRLLARVEEARGDFEAALRHLQTHLGLQERIRHDEVRSRLAEIGHRDRLRQAREEADRLRSLARTDPLTGVANRGWLDQRAGEEFDRARRFGRPLTLLMIDLDDFKAVNDRLSHQTGDAVLIQTARILKENTRQEDLVGRYGGDEFQVLLVETSGSQGLQIARKLQDALEAFPWQSIHPQLAGQRVSMGAAAAEDCPDAASWTALADRELYEEKRRRKAGLGGVPAPGELH